MGGWMGGEGVWQYLLCLLPPNYFVWFREREALQVFILSVCVCVRLWKSASRVLCFFSCFVFAVVAPPRHCS